MKRVLAAEAAATLADREALQELNAAFAHCLDHADYDGLSDLFMADARYTSGPRVLEGSAGIVRWFVERAENGGPRTTRHMGSGLRLQFDGATSARGHAVWISYACNAPVPIDQLTPFLVADFDDVYTLCDDGHWRIAERRITPVFRNPQAAPAA